ncbi:MAG: N-acetylmuramoyl-L-alanine amidase, partial [Anaerolineae bacterium]|nr:N-acetylmuramoyl-L-alanine amidase [Anaerolineae bacterium]
MARPLNDSPYLYGFHDPGGEEIMAEAGIFGWILFTEAIGCDPNDTSGRDYTPWANRGFGILVRLNNGYAPEGTIPPAARYSDFAKRCANFVRSSPGAHIWIIGNEMNHPIERPGAKIEGDRVINPGETITPSMYANCYRQCRAAIKAVPGHQNDQVIVGAVAPWNNSTVYDGNPNGDWCKYLTDILTILGPANCDGIAIHTYTHGANPEFIYNDYRMNPPFQNRQYHFRAYRDFMQAIPPSMRTLPVYITETDQDDPWSNVNNGWVQRAYGEIDAWNKTPGTQKIRALILYRYPRIDRWYIEGKAGVIDDFKQALRQKYSWEKYLELQPEQPPAAVAEISFPQTGKKARGAFAAFHQKYGVEITGYPISDEYTHPESGLKTQDWQRLTMEEYPAGSGQVRLRLVGVEAAELRQKVTALQQQVALLQEQIKKLQQGGAVAFAPPPITDITAILPRNAAGFFKRPVGAIQYIVINHTAVRPEVGAERVAQAHMQRWPGIVAQFFITKDGEIQQTNPIDEVVAQNQPWIYNGISVYVAGKFDDTVPADAQLNALAALCAWLMATYNLPLEAIKGARELITTGSPGEQWMAGQNWKNMLLERVRAQAAVLKPSAPAADGEAAALRAQVAALQGQISALQAQIQSLNGQIASLQERNAALQAEIELLRSQAAPARLNPPAIRDISQQLPRTAGALKARPTDRIKYLVFNHTAVDPSVGADKLAAAHQKRWGAILYHFFITADGTIQQTNPLDQTVDLTQPWLAEGINIAVAGDFTALIPNDAQLQAAAQLSAWLLQEYKLPVEAVKGVSEFIATQSPGAQWLQGKNWKGLLLARIADLQKTVAPGGGAPADTGALLALRAQIKELQQALNQAQSTISALTAERDQLRTQLGQMPNVAQLNQQIQTLTQQLQAAATEKQALQQQVQNLTNDRNALNQRVQALTNDKAALTQQVTALNGQIEPLRQALAQAQADISALTLERDQLQAQLQAGGDTAQLRQQIQTLTAQIQQAAAEKATLNQRIQALTAERDGLTQKIAGLNQTIADLQRKLQQAQILKPDQPGGAAPSDRVPPPEIKDVVDQLPKHAINCYKTRSLDRITHITIHHSAGPANISVEQIASYHVKTQNWPGIGYHFVIGPDGTTYQAVSY